MVRRNVSLMLLVSVLVFGLTAGVAKADLIAYEGFDYDVDSDLEGLDGGTGFDGAWYLGGYLDPYEIVIGAGSLEHHGVATSGNKLECKHDDEVDAGLYRDLPSTLPDDGTTYWFSFLMQRTNPSASTINWYGFEAGIEPYSLWCGQPLARTNFGIALGPSTFVPATQLSWLVMKVETNTDASGNEIAYLWVDPPLGPEPSTASADVTHTFNFNGGFSTVSVGHGGDHPAPGDAGMLFDELRIATTYADVIPEPATVALLGLGSLALIRRKRR